MGSPLYLNFGMATLPDSRFTAIHTSYNRLTASYESYTTGFVTKTPLVLDLGLGLKFLFLEHFLAGFEMGAYQSFFEKTNKSIEPNVYFPSSYTPSVTTPFLVNYSLNSLPNSNKEINTSGAYFKILFGMAF